MIYALQVQHSSLKFCNQPCMCMRAALLQSKQADSWLDNRGIVLQQALHILQSLFCSVSQRALSL